VLATGTFLGGKIHIGLKNFSGGRAGDSPANALSKRLRELPFQVERLKTGTPPRVDARSVDFSKMQTQLGDRPLPIMSYLGKVEDHPEQLPCYITHTNEKTHDIIREGLDRSPMYTGVIEGLGPRYCPSIEDKIQRFKDKNSHQVFIEPEGLTCNELYPNGISTSLPFDVQLAMIHSIVGMENAHIIRPGYAIEYDYFDPCDLNSSLETKHMKGLFFAGQINGTTGYEEAAAQGLLAGINAALKIQEKDFWCPRRDEAYIGVLVDDLITHGTTEPYRMFTSRAEYRLLLREDNADLRLTEKGRRLQLVNDERWQSFCNKKEGIIKERERLNSAFIHPETQAAKDIENKTKKTINREYNLMELLRRPELNYSDVASLCGIVKVDTQVAEQVEIAAKYQGYIERQQEEISRMRRHEGTLLPISMDYNAIDGLSNEVKQKLNEHQPANLGQASRIQGVTPAAISLLLVHLKKRNLLKRNSA